MAIIKGTINRDELLAGSEDIVLGLEGNDEIDAGLGSGGNTLGGGADNDLLYAGTGDLVLGDTGNDELDAGDEGGNNSLYGGKGQDTLYAGKNDKVFGGAGDDTLYAGTGDNTLYGGTGRDRFWLANAEVPTSVNTVADFDAQADQIAIKLDGVDSLTDLTFQQTGADTVIKLAATGESLGILKNVDANDLNAENVVFSENAPLTASIRVATFNASLNRNNLGQLITDLSTPNHPQAKNIAEIIQRNNPDILLLNEFDYDANSEAIALFKSNYLGVSQNGVAPVDYPYVYLAPSNTGVDSGLDLDKNGVLGQGNDAFGFGTFPGQYGMVVLSKYPLITDQVRTFQNFLWKDMPGNLLTNDPTANPLSGENGYYSPEAVDILRLSSKSHWDIPVNVNGEIVHILAAHPTPPVFDGAEDRNGKRNYDEIRFWSDYVTPGKGDYAYDDQGNQGGLRAGERFVILGDYNADPFDGDSYQGAANQFFNNPAIAGSTTDATLTPGSNGAPEASQQQGGSNAQHQGNPSFDTADFADTTPGNLRVDYVLPSTNLNIEDGGVFWPTKSDPLFGIVGEFNPSLDSNIYPSRTPSSDHRLVYNDLTIPTKANTQARKTVTGVENLGLVTFSTDTSFKNTQVGGLSGIVYDQAQNRYYAISDDRSSINPARFYTLDINLSDGRLDNGDVSFTQVTTLLDSQGNPFPANSLDTEGIALTENGSVYISSEGEVRPTIPRITNPFVNEFSLSGQQLSQLPIDEKFFAVDGTTKGIRNNLAFESLTITPDGRYLYTATENALAQDGSASTLENTSLSRIVKYDLTTGQVVAEFIYEVEPIPKASNPVGGFADNGLVELLAIDNNGTLLSLERSFAAGVGNTVKLYQIQTQGALDVSSFDDLFWEAENTRFVIDSPVKKKLLVDFQADLGITPDNLEGLSLGPVLPDGRQSLIVVSDNNFSATQTTQFIALGLDIQTTTAVLPVIETADAIDDGNGETTTLGLLGDSDDPAVWIDPDNAEDSLIIGTLKDGGLAVFSLDGEVLQKITPTDILGATAQFGDLRYNNVDVLYNFQLGTETVDIALVSDRANDTLNLFKIDPTTHTLVNITSSQLLAPAFSVFGVDDGEATVYGLAGYRSPVSGKSYAFVTQAGGNKIAQLEIKADAQGLITAEVVRTINLPIAAGKTASDYQSEAIAVDQEKGIVYLAVENEIGIVKFAAEPNGGDTVTIVRPVGSPELVPDLEGLAIYYGPNGTGYLVASSQGDSSYAVYSREGSNSYLGSFVVGDNLPAGIDQANETDGLEIINVPLGPTFPFGALLVQDGANDPQNAIENGDELENNNTNFKFVRWDDVANAFETPLIVDTTSYNPRNSDLNPQSLVNGIASGDVDQNSAILWARSLFVGEVTFEYSKTADFAAIAGKKTVNVTDSTIPVKVEVMGLTANTEYFYRVTDAAGDTATGRFQTAALAGEKKGLTFGVSGDWRGELAPYPAISNVAVKKLDFFVEHGDTIYADYGSDAVLNADGSRKDQVETLAEYRAKQAEVYGSRLGENYWADLRASTSVFATIDDHEVINDFAGGAEASTDERFSTTTGLINDTELYENGLTAFQEYNPLVDKFYADNTGDVRFDGERKLYRNNAFGKDASVFVLDTRSFRDEAINFTDGNNDTIPDDPAAVIVDSLTTERTLLGSVQLAEFKQDLLAAQASGQTWKFVMLPEPIQNILPGINVDAYEGYGKERTELLKFINDNKITNVVFVAADIHTTSVNNLTYQLAPGGEQIATSAFEITTGAVAFDQPLGEVLGNFVSVSNPTFAAGYAAAPIAPDTDSNPDDKDDLVKLAIKQQILQPGGFDPIGLNDNLAQAEGLIDATLLQGDYFVGHSYGWTEFDVDPLTQKLTVTTYGIDAYSEAEILAQAGNLDSLTPKIVSQFEVTPQSESNPTPEPPITLSAIGTYATGQYNQSAAEIPAYDPASKRLFVVNAQNGKVDVVDASDPTNPTLITSIDTSAFGLPNSVAIKDGLVAIAVENADKQAKGQVVFYSANSPDFATPLKALEVGALPDMLTFSPDGKKVLVANEGEPNGTYTNDPEGSVSIIDLSLGINSATVQTADFTAFNNQFAELKTAGVKFKGDVGTTRTVAQDLEPEYIAFSPDGTKAWVTLQEANAIAVIDIATATVESIKPLGFKDYSVPSTRLETFEFSNLPSIGKTAANQELFLGGFSGLFYEGTAANGNLKFVTHTDRGPNGEPTGSNRPFLLPNFSPEIVRFELNRSTGVITLTERINLKQADGTPITGLPNTSIAGGNGNTPYNDEVPVDLQGNPITPLDKLGGDFEAIVLANDGSFWMVDEYRPAIYHFGTDGKLIERFVPQGTAVAAGQPAGTFGTEVLPSVIAQRRQNRGFEAVALNKDNNKLYAFVQSPLRNPTTLSNSNLNSLNNVRIIEFDVVTKTVTAEYLYRLDNGNLGTTDNTRPDKIGDAVYIGNGEFLLVERDDDAIDSDPLSNIEKKVYRFSLDGATNVLNQDAPIDLGSGNLKTIDQMTPAELVSQGINLVAKTLHVDLAKAGYNTVEKVEGLTLVDANTIAVLNDNDFQVAGITINADGTFTPDPDPEPVVLGLITTQPQELDASDRDNAVNIRNWSIFGMYQPDAIASYTANNQTYYITANEGDAREYGDYVEAARVKDLNIDPTAFPDAADLKTDSKLGRLLVTKERGDTDGDGDYDQLYTFGGRSFSIWNNQGQLVYDSGDDFERITAEQFPEFFNASNSNNTFDNRSDDKGPEPEGVVTGNINGRTYAFVGLERIGGVMVYDVTDPVSPSFVQYINNRDFTAATDSAAAKDLGPEGLAFISAQDSPNGKPLLVVANEVSGSTTFYQIDLNEAPINNPPTAVTLSNTVTALAENSNTTGGIKVATINITDDGQGTNVLSLSGADAASFEIRNNELFFIGNSPDFETKAKYDVTVNVDDLSVGETPDASTNFTLNITDVNETPVNNPPTAVVLSNKVTELAENSNTTGGIKVATINITDDGQGTNVLSLSGADVASFEIRNNELFFIGNSPDFETKNQYDVTVNVDDITVGATPDASIAFTLNVIDVNEVPTNNPPTAIILSNTVTQLAENSNTTGGIKVATINITDDSQGTNVLSLSEADAASFEIRNNELFFIGNSPDFETKTKYDVTVNVDDKSIGETPDASTDFRLNITNLSEQDISDRVTQFNNKGDNRGSLVYNLSDVSGNAKTQGDDAALNQTDALFHNLVGLYQVENDNGAILDTLDLNGNGAIDDLLNPGDTGYARTAMTNAVNNFVLQIGADGDPTNNTSASEFGDVLLQGGKRYSPFAIANGGDLIPTGGTLQDGINNFLAQNPNNTAANLSNFITHAVAYFSFGSANPDGAEHLQNRGNNVFGFEDLPGNLGISDFDFNDAVFKFTFIG